MRTLGERSFVWTNGKTRIGSRRPQLRRPRGQTKAPKRTCSVYDTEPHEQITIAVPAIVSEELFECVQEQLNTNRSRSLEWPRGAKYLLQGLLECECCGHAYYGTQVSRNRASGKVSYAYYRCVGTDAHRLGGKRVCQNKPVRLEMLDQAVWTDTCELLRNPILLRREYESRLASPESSDTERSLQKQIANFQRTMNRLIDIHTDGLIDRDEFEPRMERARKRHAELSSKFESLVTQSRDQSAIREALACIDSFSEAVCANLDQADWNTRREILRTLIERVQIAPNQIRIIYRINFPLFVKKASNAKSLHFCWRSAMTTLTRFIRDSEAFLDYVEREIQQQRRSHRSERSSKFDTESVSAPKNASHVCFPLAITAFPIRNLT